MYMNIVSIYTNFQDIIANYFIKIVDQFTYHYIKHRSNYDIVVVAYYSDNGNVCKL
jgi:hypothetical protein